MRAFVALEISSEQVLDSIVAFQGELAATGADLKLTERENIHFTVKFLGEMTDPQAEDARIRLRGLKLSGGDVEVRGVGAFPRPSRPSVVWVGAADERAEVLKSVAEPAIKALQGLGQNDQRPFHPHATVARVRSLRGSSRVVSSIRENEGRSFGTFKLASLKLKSSQLRPSGPVYTDIEAFPLV